MDINSFEIYNLTSPNLSYSSNLSCFKLHGDRLPASFETAPAKTNAKNVSFSLKRNRSCKQNSRTRQLSLQADGVFRS